MSEIVNTTKAADNNGQANVSPSLINEPLFPADALSEYP